MYVVIVQQRRFEEGSASCRLRLGIGARLRLRLRTLSFVAEKIQNSFVNDSTNFWSTARPGRRPGLISAVSWSDVEFKVTSKRHCRGYVVLKFSSRYEVVVLS